MANRMSQYFVTEAEYDLILNQLLGINTKPRLYAVTVEQMQGIVEQETVVAPDADEAWVMIHRLAPYATLISVREI